MSALTQLVASAQAFIEKASRPGVLGLVGQKLERGCARDLKAYFLELKTKVEALHLEDRQWDAGTARHVVEAALANVLRKQRETLTSTLRVNLQTAYLASLKMDHMQESEDELRDETGKWTSGGSSDLASGSKGLAIAALGTVGLIAIAKTLSGAKSLIGTPYNKLNCSQFACALTGHKPANAKQLFDEGQPGTLADAQPGNIVAFNGGHVAVMTKDGLMDSTPERGVGMTGTPNKNDGWYRGPIHIVKGGTIKEAAGDAGNSSLPNIADRAALWATHHAAEMVQGIDETTIDRLASVIEQGIEERLGAYGTGRLIRAELDDMSVSRSVTIASTEINRAMSTAMFDKLDFLDVGYKQWISSADPCDICQDNIDAGVIPLNEEFPSGDLFPPAHPNDRCAMTGARAPESEDQE